MSTTDFMHTLRAMPVKEQAVAMAVTVLLDRIQRLSTADRADLFALMKELPVATTEEDQLGIAASMLEIFECGPATIQAVCHRDNESRPDSLHAWSQFVGKRVQEAREAAGLTQAQLSEKTGLPQPHISRIETAKLSPSRATIEKIAKALGKEVADFDHNAPRNGAA